MGRSWRRQGGGAPWNESATWWGDLACVVDGEAWERVATSGQRPLDPSFGMMDNTAWERGGGDWGGPLDLAAGVLDLGERGGEEELRQQRQGRERGAEGGAGGDG